MFSLFPCDWIAPKPNGLFASKKKINKIRKSVALNPEQLAALNINIPNPKPVKPEPLNKGFANYDLSEEAKKFMPAEEMCSGENIDNSEVDKMLSDMNGNSSDVKARQMMKMMAVINANLDKNINIL